jgi:hypothetical protein
MKGVQALVTTCGDEHKLLAGGRPYRASYRTFEDYCREHWQFSKAHANRMIDAAAEVTNNLTPMGVIPTNERQLRPLAGLEPEA